MSRIRAVDWDGTLVDAKTQDWLPGARISLVQLLAESRNVIIHTCRASWPEGLASIMAKLDADAAFRRAIADGKLTVEPKPRADDYIDNQAIRHFTWPETMLDLRRIESPA